MIETSVISYYDLTSAPISGRYDVMKILSDWSLPRENSNYHDVTDVPTAGYTHMTES